MVNSVFNVPNLLHENFDTTRTIYDSFIEETYLFKTLNFISEMKKEYRDASSVLYVSLTESSNNIEIVNESFSTFFAKVKDIIDKFIKFVKTLISKFIVSLNNAVKSEKFINKHKRDLDRFSDKHEFNMDLYTFTHLTDSDIPKSIALTTFQKEYTEMSKILETLASSGNDANRLDAVTSKYNEFVNLLQNDWYDKFRGELIGSNDSISSSNFASELFSLFRNNSSDTYNETINSSIVSEALSRFEKNHDIEKSIEKTKTQITKDYESIKNQISKMMIKGQDNKINLKLDASTSVNYNYTVTSEIMNKLDLFIKAKADQVSQMSTIHSIALSAKLDAITACFKQDKTILYKALYKVQGSVVRGESAEEDLLDFSDEDDEFDEDIIEEATLKLTFDQAIDKLLKTNTELKTINKTIPKMEIKIEKAKNKLSNYNLSNSKKQFSKDFNHSFWRNFWAMFFFSLPGLIGVAIIDMKTGDGEYKTYTKNRITKYENALSELKNRKKELEKGGK